MARAKTFVLDSPLKKSRKPKETILMALKNKGLTDDEVRLVIKHEELADEAVKAIKRTIAKADAEAARLLKARKSDLFAQALKKKS